MSRSEKYGSKCWCIFPAKGDAIQISADRIEVNSAGALLAFGGYRNIDDDYATDESFKEMIVYAFAPGQWKEFYAASCFDGSAVCRD